MYYRIAPDRRKHLRFIYKNTNYRDFGGKGFHRGQLANGRSTQLAILGNVDNYDFKVLETDYLLELGCFNIHQKLFYKRAGDPDDISSLPANIPKIYVLRGIQLDQQE